MKKLSLLDLGFFITETKANPKHVAGLMVFKRPARSGADFARNLYEQLKSSGQPTEPFMHRHPRGYRAGHRDAVPAQHRHRLGTRKP